MVIPPWERIVASPINRQGMIPLFRDAQGLYQAKVTPEVPSLHPVEKRTLAARRDAHSSKREERVTMCDE